MDKLNCIVIAAGGTGGHVFPSIGLANYLMKDYDIEILFGPKLNTQWQDALANCVAKTTKNLTDKVFKNKS